MLSQSFHSPGTFFLDSMDYSSNSWGFMDSSIVAEDFIAEDNGELIFANRVGTDIEIFAVNLALQTQWSSTSSGVPATSTQGELRIKKGKNGDYWIYILQNDPTIYNYHNGTWSHISGDIAFDFEVNALNEPIILSGLAQIKRYSSGNWVTELDSNLVAANGSQSQICIDQNDSIHYILSKTDFVLPTYIHLATLDNGTLIPNGDSLLGSIEEVTKVDLIADSNDVLHAFYSTLSLGPWSDIYHSKQTNEQWVPGAIMRIQDYPNHLGSFRSPIVDEYNCTHLPYTLSTDIFVGTDTTHARVRKFCDCQYIADQNTVTIEDNSLVSLIDLPVNYQWIDCPNFTEIPNAMDSIYSPASNGSYALIIETNGCADTSSCQTVSTLSLSQMSNNYLSIHPNPTNNELTVSLGYLESDIPFTISEPNGRVVRSGLIQTSETDLSLSDLPEGIYFLQLFRKTEKETLRIIKQ